MPRTEKRQQPSFAEVCQVLVEPFSLHPTSIPSSCARPDPCKRVGSFQEAARSLSWTAGCPQSRTQSLLCTGRGPVDRRCGGLVWSPLLGYAWSWRRCPHNNDGRISGKHKAYVQSHRVLPVTPFQTPCDVSKRSVGRMDPSLSDSICGFAIWISWRPWPLQQVVRTTPRRGSSLIRRVSGTWYAVPTTRRAWRASESGSTGKLKPLKQSSDSSSSSGLQASAPLYALAIPPSAEGYASLRYPLSCAVSCHGTTPGWMSGTSR
jgi:hypothetical protein